MPFTYMLSRILSLVQLTAAISFSFPPPNRISNEALIFGSPICAKANGARLFGGMLPRAEDQPSVRVLSHWNRVSSSSSRRTSCSVNNGTAILFRGSEEAMLVNFVVEKRITTYRSSPSTTLSDSSTQTWNVSDNRPNPSFHERA